MNVLYSDLVLRPPSLKTMNQLEVPVISYLHNNSPIILISTSLDNLHRHRIDNAPWPEFNYVPEVSFSIGHNNKCLFIKYYVSEAILKATYYKPNDPVYKDSCVEFFISFDEEKEYYNFEFNALGTCKLNFGTKRHGRKIISEDVIETIRYIATIQNKKGSGSKPDKQWDLTLMIPVEAFSEHTINSLSGKTCSVNFYKCGDDLPEPHFLAWNNIEAINPDFHVPECFGKMKFL